MRQLLPRCCRFCCCWGCGHCPSEAASWGLGACYRWRLAGHKQQRAVQPRPGGLDACRCGHRRSCQRTACCWLLLLVGLLAGSCIARCGCCKVKLLSLRCVVARWRLVLHEQRSNMSRVQQQGVPPGCTYSNQGVAPTAALQCEFTHTPQHRLAQQGGRLIKSDQRALLECQQAVAHAAAGSCCVNSWLGRLQEEQQQKTVQAAAGSGLVAAQPGVRCTSLKLDQGHSGPAQVVSMVDSSKQLCVVGWCCCCVSPLKAACTRPSRNVVLYSSAFLHGTAHMATSCLLGHCC